MGLLHHQRETYGFQLTDAELEAVQKYKNLPAEAIEILRREGAGGVHTQAFIKLYHRLRAERLVYQEALHLRAMKEQLATVTQLEEALTGKDKTIRALELEMAVDAAPTGR